MNSKLFYVFSLFILVFSKKIVKKQKKIINVSFAINNKYIFKVLTPLISLCENGNRDTIYYIYILVGENFEQRFIKFLSSLEKIYFNCFIYFKNIGKDFENVYKSFLDESTYYRLKLPIILPNTNRIIYLDSDLIILKDLMEFYILNFNKNYILGKLDKYPNALDELLYIKNYINAGVLLMDLYNLRKYRYVDKFMDYIKNHNNDKKYLHSHDQTLINYICHDKIGILPLRYHMWPYLNEEALMDDNKKLRIPYNVTEIIKDYHDAFLVHFPGGFKNKGKFGRTYYYRRYVEYNKKSNDIKMILYNTSKF